MPKHILAPAAVACDIFRYAAVRILAERFFALQDAISCKAKEGRVFSLAEKYFRLAFFQKNVYIITIAVRVVYYK